MAKIIGVRFRNMGKVYHFDAADLEMKIGDHVIVETSRGLEYGRVVFAPRERLESDGSYPLKEVLRISTPEDDAQEEENLRKEKDAYRLCVEKIREHRLNMKLIAAEYTFNNRVMFYFTADGRVDFRQLVKDLASILKTRIELRQVGVRDETKFLGGIGICGRPLCCATYLTDFAPVSIRMAKDQNLSLNQTKISGVCGRLMCCLKNEQDTYEDLNKNMPAIGDIVTLPDGMQGTVHSVNVLRQTVKVTYEINDEKEISEYPVADLVLFCKKRFAKANQEAAQKNEPKAPEEAPAPRRRSERPARESRPPRGERPEKGSQPPKEGKKKKPLPPKEGKPKGKGGRPGAKAEAGGEKKKQSSPKKRGPEAPRGEAPAKKPEGGGKGKSRIPVRNGGSPAKGKDHPNVEPKGE